MSRSRAARRTVAASLCRGARATVVSASAVASLSHSHHGRGLTRLLRAVPAKSTQPTGTIYKAARRNQTRLRRAIENRKSRIENSLRLCSSPLRAPRPRLPAGHLLAAAAKSITHIGHDGGHLRVAEVSLRRHHPLNFLLPTMVSPCLAAKDDARQRLWRLREDVRPSQGRRRETARSVVVTLGAGLLIEVLALLQLFGKGGRIPVPLPGANTNKAPWRSRQ